MKIQIRDESPETKKQYQEFLLESAKFFEKMEKRYQEILKLYSWNEQL